MAKKTPKIKASKRCVVTLADFRAGHYHSKGLNTDMYYVGFANKLYSSLLKFIKEDSKFNSKLAKNLVLNLAWHLEDLVSGGSVWKAFVSLCRKKYGRDLPFIDTTETEFSTDWPSTAGIRFMIWYSFMAEEDEIFINPEDPFITLLELYAISAMEEGYDNAPDTLGRPIIWPEEEMGVPVFFQVRDICFWLCTGCYLTHAYKLDIIYENVKVLADYIHSDSSQTDYLYQAYMPFNAKIGPVAAYAHEWLAEILASDDTVSDYQYHETVGNIKSVPYTLYRYENLRKDGATIISLDGTERELSAFTLPDEKLPSGLINGDGVLMSIIYFDGKWMVNGFAAFGTPGATFLSIQKEWKEIMAQRTEVYRLTMEAFKKKRLGVCAGYKAYLEMFPTIDASAKGDVPEALVECENLVYFLNSDGEVSLLTDWGSCIKLRGNKFYDKKEAEEDASLLIYDHSLATPELRQWIIDHNLIPDAAMTSKVSVEYGKKLFQENMRFINDFLSRDDIDVFSPEMRIADKGSKKTNL